MSGSIFIKTQAAIDASNDRYKLSRTVLAIETAYADQQSGLVIGQCKSALESLSKSILDELEVEYESDAKVQKLAKKCLQSLKVAEGVEREAKAREAFNKLIGSYTHSVEVAAQALGELRNEFCPLAHGKSSTHQPLDFFYAELVARQTDAVIAFICELHANYRVLEPEIAIQDNPDFNEFLNESHDSIEILGDVYLPHEILYQMNEERYISALEDYIENQQEEEVEA